MRSAKVSADNPSVALRAPAPVVPKAWPPPTKRRWRLGRRSWYPKFFARYRSQNFDHCHSFLRAFSAPGGARKRPPFHKGAFGTGDADCRVASLLAMTVLILCHSEEAQRADVGIRSFLRWTGVRAAESSAPTGGCGKPPATAGAALSEAESAERAAGQIRSLPDDLRGQHGVQGSEVCERPRPCSRRGCVD